MKKTTLGLLLACFVTLAATQAFTGGQLPHLETGITIADGGAADITAANTFTISLNRAPFDAGEEVNIATSLQDFTYYTFTSGVATPNYYVHIEVVNPTMTVNLKAFQYSIKTVNSQANVINVALKIKRVRLGYILVGSNFGGYYTPTLPSSYIFARNSAMVAPAATGSTLVDFKTSTQESPFLYTPSTTNYPGCGAVKKNGNWIIEIVNCTSIRATLFLTGFDMQAQGGATDTILIGNTIANLQVDLQSTSAVFTADPTKDGLAISPTTLTNVNFFQLSMVVIGLREYSQGTYPVQGSFIDNFDANSYISLGLKTYASTGIVLAADPSAVPIETPNTYDPAKFGHRFCGLTGFSQTTPAYTANTQQYVGFVLSDPEWNPNLPLNLLYVAPYTPPAPLAATANILATATFQVAESCLLLTANNPCVETLTPITISNPTAVANPTTSATVTFSGTGSYASSSDPNKLSPVNVLATQSITGTTTITYTATVQASALKVGDYQGVVYLTTPTVPSPAVQATITIDVFGNRVVTETSDIIAAKYWHFGFQNSNLVNNTIVITYTVNSPTTAINNQVFEIGLFSHAQVIALNQTCTTVCANYTGYTVGIDYTASPPKCIICDSSLNLVYSPVDGQCVCSPGYYINAGVCTVCTVTLCGTCTASATTCTQCMPNAQFINPATPATGCACNSGFYKSGGTQCLACSPGCATCTTGNDCATCVANSNTRQNTTLNCACLPGFYEAGTGVCPSCAPECLTCSGSATNCLSCNTTANFNLTGTTCQCLNGYYVAIVNSQPQCLKCHFSCANCSGDAAACIACASPQWTKQGTACVCNKILKYVYYANMTVDGFCVDQTCSNIDPQCVECSMILFTGQAICKTCNSLANFTLSTDNKTCVCKSGFLLVNGTCVPCGTGCQTCNPVTTCSSCALGGYSTGPATCSCQPGTYLTTAYSGGLLQCMPCNPNCAECQIDPSVCTRCQNGFSTINNTCVCAVGKYATPDNVNCVNCMTGCAQCNNATVCISCTTGYILSTGTCQLNCPVGTFNGGDQCVQCGDNCKMCNSAIDCRVCNTGFLLYLGSCRATCPTGTYPFSNSLCIACSTTCATCSGAPNTCLTCSGSLILSGSQCIAACPNGTYFNGAACAACAAPCTACTGAANRCTACPPGQYAYNNQCFTQCPTAIVNGVCSGICPDGSYLSGTSCLKCSLSCKTCSSATVCSSCNNNLVMYRGGCQVSCPANTILSGGACLDCDPNCVGCSGTTTSCINCLAGTYRLLDRCYAQCPPGYYSDFATVTCKKCDANCKTCSGPGQCSACIDGTVPANGLCANGCGANCLSCADTVCTQCSQGFYWNGVSCQTYCPPGATPTGGICICPTGQFLNLGNCVSQCSPGFANVNNQCLTCQNPCKTCTGSITSCDSCIDGYTFDQVNKKCTQAATCPFGQYSSNFADCRFICPDGTYYLDSACYVGRCPAGYTIDTARRICTKSTVNTGCSDPLFLQGANCVQTCDAGFYPNTVTRVCTACSPNCLACSGPNVCTSCAPGTSLSGNVCTVSPDPCPAGQFRYNDICVSGCPTGTFASGGYCVRICASRLFFYNSGCYATCPTNLNTPDACVVVCPFGYTRNGNVCVAGAQTSCPQGQYFNTAIGACDNCRYPCSTCSGLSTFCTACTSSFSLRNGVCVSDTSCPAGSYVSTTGCARCPLKCATCSDANTCTSCAAGYTNTGADCVQTATPLTPVTLQQVAAVKNGNVVYVQIQPNILPNNLPTSLASQILLFVPSISNPASQVNIWVQDGMIFVALTHPGPIPSYTASFLLNTNVFDSIYRSMGYSTANAAISVPISSSLPDAPVNITIPTNAMASRTFSLKNLAVVTNTRLNSVAYKSIVNLDRAA